jgi:methionyl-tRNA synthetase
MTEKICKKCGTWQPNGYYCEGCGTQLFPDIGNTEWKIPNTIKWSEHHKFDRWSGKLKEAKP